MTIIDKLLVLFDDQKTRQVSDVKKIYSFYTKQILSSAMGRMVSRGWLTKVKKSSYQITKIGREVVSLSLSHLKNIDKKRELQFYLVMFNIPEKNRSARDVVRIGLRKNGFGQLHNSVWLSIKGNSIELNSLIKELHIQNNIIILPIKVSPDKQEILIRNCQWNFAGINKSYFDFIKQATKYLKKDQKDPITARNLIFEYSLAVRQDPQLEEKYHPPKFKAKETYNLYKKIRGFCY